jgi:hypothetical protein
MNTCEGQASKLSLETRDPKSLESPLELQMEDQITTLKKKTRKSEDTAIRKEQEQ